MPNLVGIGNSQTPTNAMLGGLAYQDSVGEIDIEKVKARTGDTATDVFVYDTRKDSDGGAWRHRTQNTSWYNEGASRKRGARKEFPAVAVIVCLSNHIKIYDGDDSNLSLWMDVRATTARRDHGWMYGSTLNAVVALNGIIAIAASWSIGDEGGVLVMDFVKDELRRHEGGTGRSGGGLSIINRETSTNLNIMQDVSIIKDPYVNDVAMTLLPNALIDSSTGLPIPTIAAATNAGVSVIKDDNTVVDIYRTNDDDVHHVDFDGDRVVMFMELGGVYVAKIPSADQSGNPNSAWSVYGSFGGNTSGVDYPKIQAQGHGADIVSMKDHTFAAAGWNGTWDTDETKGISILAEDIVYSGDGMVAWIQSNFNTGYMFGDIKGAYLADTSTDSLTNTNLVSNGTFDSDISGWTAVGQAQIAHDSGRLKITSNSGNSNAYATVTCVVGKKYYFQADFEGHISFHVGIQGDAGNDVGYIPYVNYGSSTTKFCFFTATRTTMYIVPYAIGTNNVGYVDNVIVQLADHDRSINGGHSRAFSSVNGLSAGLKVNGTVSRAQVATNSDLVYYGGFSDSNYFSQPYNSAFDFGTGDLCIMFWMKNTQNDAYDDIIHRRAHNGSAYTGNGWYLQMGNDQGITLKDSASGGSRGQIDADSVYGVWRHICFVRRNNRGYAYKDGVLQSNIYTWNENLTNTSAVLTIGRATISGGGDADKTFLALVRISAGAPSREQIKKIFDDEIHLFEKNAKCTLYGTSNQVEAVAYDDSNNMLHAGTSSGRSEFQGLVRINNTTTAVTTAISASNELVAEQ